MIGPKPPESQPSYHCWFKEVNTVQTPSVVTSQVDSGSLNVVQHFHFKSEPNMEDTEFESSELRLSDTADRMRQKKHASGFII